MSFYINYCIFTIHLSLGYCGNLICCYDFTSIKYLQYTTLNLLQFLASNLL